MPAKGNWREYTNSVTEHSKALVQNKANSHRRSKRTEIIKLKAETNEVEKKEVYKVSTIPGATSLRKLTGF